MVKDVSVVPRVLMDAREPPEMKNFMEAEGLEVEVRQLDVGDYILSNNVAVERKRGPDFTSSIVDNRLFENLARVKEVYPTVILLLEEFDSTFEASMMNPSSVYGALAYCAYKMGVSVVPTAGKQHTAIFLKRVAFREQVQDRVPVIARVAPKGMDLERRRTFVVEGLVNTGPAKAAELIGVFGTPARVFSAIRKTRVLYTKTGNPKGIEGPLKKVKGLGHRWVSANKEVLFGQAGKD
ncbi:MAG: ERCC4 domain-containing protein [Promethearchaeota archaeon]